MLFGKPHGLNAFKGADIIVFLIANGHIANQDGLSVTAVPHIYTVTVSPSEVFDNGADHGLDLRRVTREHFPVKSHKRSFEKFHIITVIEVSVHTVFINEGKLHGNGV